MSFALNEVEAMAKKATRGVGYSWGLAEEAGKAARWLCAHGLDGPKALARTLTKTDGSDLKKMTPVSLQGDWYSEGGELCPLVTGAALADSASSWAKNGLIINNVIAPAMVLPFAALSARMLGSQVTVTWGGVSAVLDGSVISLEISHPESLLETAEQILVRTGGQLDEPLPEQGRASPEEVDWNILNQFAARIYAPATEESRLKGAGAGLSDND